MKYIFYFIAFGLMLWALIEQTTKKPNIYIQIIAVAVFFYLMMRLTDKTPSKFNDNDNNNESGN